MAYYHVIVKIGPEKACRSLFADLSEKELIKCFVKPYKSGATFVAGNDLIAPSDLKFVQIIVTSRLEKIERDEINSEERKYIDDFNSSSSSLFFASLGGGYEPQDIADAGDDVTSQFIKGPPGSGNFLQLLKVAAWVAGIASAVLAAGLNKWLGWL